MAKHPDPTQQQIDAAHSAITDGIKPSKAWATVGVSRDAWDTWMGNGQHAPPGHPCGLFREAVMDAQMQSVARESKEGVLLRRRMLAAAAGDWKAAAWMLERCHGYAKPVHKTEEEKASDYTDAELAAALARQRAPQGNQ